MGLVFSIELLSDGAHLTPLELADPDGPPALGGADHGAEHELEDSLLAEGVGNDFEAPSLLDEQPLKEVRGPDRAAVGDGHAQVCDAGLEVIREAGCRARQLGLVIGDHTCGEIAGDGAGRGLVGGGGPGLELGPEVFRYLGGQVPEGDGRDSADAPSAGSRSRSP